MQITQFESSALLASLSKHFATSGKSLPDRAFTLYHFVQENPVLTPAAPDTTQLPRRESGGVAKW